MPSLSSARPSGVLTMSPNVLKSVGRFASGPFVHGAATTAAVRIDSGVNANLKADLDVYSRFFPNQNNTVDTTTDNTVDDEESSVAPQTLGDLLVSWHIQEVVLPSQQEEDVSVFDPYDESQVDLSGIVNALDKVVMEDAEETD